MVKVFDSKITAKAFISTIKSEIDVALPISDESYIAWLNAVEQMLYGSVIKEQGIYETDVLETIDLPLFMEGECDIRFEDIVAVYAEASLMKKIQLLKVTAANGHTFRDVYYKNGDKLCMNISFPCDTAKVVYIRRPIVKTPDNYGEINVMMPVEFMELIAAKLRGEAYKLANEDSIAAKWINDYNALLQDFVAWCSNKRAKVGV